MSSDITWAAAITRLNVVWPDLIPLASLFAENVTFTFRHCECVRQQAVVASYFPMDEWNEKAPFKAGV